MNLRSLLGLVPAEARLTGYLALDVERYAPSPSAFRRWDGDFWATATADGPRLGRARYCTLLPGARRQEPQGSSFPGRAMGTRSKRGSRLCCLGRISRNALASVLLFYRYTVPIAHDVCNTGRRIGPTHCNTHEEWKGCVRRCANGKPTLTRCG